MCYLWYYICVNYNFGHFWMKCVFKLMPGAWQYSHKITKPLLWESCSMTTFYSNGRLLTESNSELTSCPYCGNLLSEHSGSSSLPITSTKRDVAEQLATTLGLSRILPSVLSNYQPQEKAVVLKKSQTSSIPESFLPYVHQDRKG